MVTSLPCQTSERCTCVIKIRCRWTLSSCSDLAVWLSDTQIKTYLFVMTLIYVCWQKTPTSRCWCSNRPHVTNSWGCFLGKLLPICCTTPKSGYCANSNWLLCYNFVLLLPNANRLIFDFINIFLNYQKYNQIYIFLFSDLISSVLISKTYKIFLNRYQCHWRKLWSHFRSFESKLGF